MLCCRAMSACGRQRVDVFAGGGIVVHFRFSPMDEASARAILAWRYDGPYATYNLDDGDGALIELLDPRSPHVAGRDERGELVGFFAYGTAAEVGGDPTPALYAAGGEEGLLSVGLGLRPDLTGHGLGLAFVTAGLDYAREHFAPRAFRLFVLSFNERAMRVYERAGFMRVGTLRTRTPHGEHAFIEMRRPV